MSGTLHALARWAPFLPVALAYMALLLHSLASSQFNPLGLARTSREFPAERF